MAGREAVRISAFKATTSPAATQKAVDWVHDSCGFYGLHSAGSCRQPRSCRDCLNVPVAAEPGGCYVSPYGACESMDSYSIGMDYRQDNSSTDNGAIENSNGGWYHMFPSTNTTYCDAQDAACVKCREIAVNASNENSFLASTSKFCLGADACVCIVGCEAPTWKNHVQPDCNTTRPTITNVVATTAPPLAGSETAATSGGGSHQVIWYVTVAQLPLLALIVFARARWLRSRRKQRKPPTHQLELVGWRAMHDELIERDKNRSKHAESTLNSALPPAALSAATATTPTTDTAARPPLMTRAERNVWAGDRSSRAI